jgi:hypothetical protein
MSLSKLGKWLTPPALLAVLGLPGPALAQNRSVELAPFAGWHLPTEPDALDGGTREATRHGTVAGGGRLTIWASEAVGVEFSGGFSAADVRVTSTRGVFPRGTDLIFGSAKLAFNLTPGSRVVGIVVSGGAAGLRFGKTIPDADASETKFGGVVGLSVRLPFLGGLSIRGDVEDYIYQADFGLGKKTAQDLVLSAGLVIGF